MKFPQLIAVLLIALPVQAIAKPTNLGNHTACFIENSGQITDQFHQIRHDIDAVFKGNGNVVAFVGNGNIHYQFYKSSTYKVFPPSQPGNHPSSQLTIQRLDVELVGANPYAIVVKDSVTDYYERFIYPWLPGNEVVAHSFSRLKYKDVYPGIDWVIYSDNNRMKSEFRVAAGADASLIRLKYSGTSNLFINNNGELVAETALGKVIEDAPVSFKYNGSPLSSHYELNGNELSYRVQPTADGFVLDPGVSWSTYCGDAGDDWALSVVVDNSGAVYSCGATSSSSTMATTGAYQSTFGGVEDGYLVKTNSSGNRLWCTYYGGPTDEEPYTLAVDASGNVYMSGWTTSTSGIATSGSYQETYGGGGWDSYIVRFTPTGARVWGTFFGGPGNEEGWGLAVDASGGVYLTGNTNSTSNIASSGAASGTFAGHFDCFLAKFNSAGTSRIWGTYYGGTNDDYGSQVTVDPSGNILVSGYTASSTGIATSGAFQASIGSTTTYDAFLAKYNSSGNVAWSTYCGGAAEDRAYGVVTDAASNIYVSGFTESTSAIATAGSFHPSYGGGQDGMLVKYNPSGGRIWGTYIGSTGYDPSQAVTINSSGYLFVTGRTNSAYGITTAGTWQVTLGGGISDAYLMKFDTACHQLWATYLGGEGTEFGTAVAANSSSVYLAGSTSSTLAIGIYPGFDTSFGGGASDGYLTSFNDCLPGTVSPITGPTTVCQNSNITLSCATSGGYWSVDDGSLATVSSGIVTGLNAGTAHVSYAVSSSGCGSAFSVQTVTIFPTPITAGISGSSTLWVGATTTLTDTPAGGVWSTSNARASVNTSGQVTGLSAGAVQIYYTVTNSFGCNSTDTFNMTISDHTAILETECASCIITVFPDPARDLITVSGLTGDRQMIIQDLTGRSYAVNKKQMNARAISISIAELPPGLFLLQVQGLKTIKFRKE